MTEVRPVSPGVTHDQAANLLGVAPRDLERLVADGHIRRNDRTNYSVPVLVADYVAHLRACLAGTAGHPQQADVAGHLDMSDRSVREIESRLSLPADYTMADIRIAYIRHLREVAAGRGGESAVELATERALLAREQREGQAIKNAVARKEYAPVGLLSDVLGMASSAVVDRFDQLEGVLNLAAPNLPDEAKTAVMTVIADARNVWIRSTASIVAEAIDAMLDADDGLGADVDADEVDATA